VRYGKALPFRRAENGVKNKLVKPWKGERIVNFLSPFHGSSLKDLNLEDVKEKLGGL
jgi:hypothetical protein